MIIRIPKALLIGIGAAVLLGVGLAVGLLIAGGSSRSQSDEVREVAQNFTEAWTARDSAGICANLLYSKQPSYLSCEKIIRGGPAPNYFGDAPEGVTISGDQATVSYAGGNRIELTKQDGKWLVVGFLACCKGTERTLLRPGQLP